MTVVTRQLWTRHGFGPSSDPPMPSLIERGTTDDTVVGGNSEQVSETTLFVELSFGTICGVLEVRDPGRLT